MNTHAITLNDVNLHYASTAFQSRSLKSLLSSTLNIKQTRPRVKDIHALKNITLTIRKGERVGLLGHNGAGKSTLLKTVAGLYPVSSGEISVQGQIRALFDLSLGFEPDATGRENILYRGLLLGMTPRYMRDIASEIIRFADLGEFIDYPVKTYSAGMQVRLAFSISTITGGNILLLDEILGAGDASFMAKAKARIQSLIEGAEIVLLASHDLHTMASICERGLVFHHGSLHFDGPIHEAIQDYQRLNGLV